MYFLELIENRVSVKSMYKEALLNMFMKYHPANQCAEYDTPAFAGWSSSEHIVNSNAQN